jgi:GTP-binding protein EngB required for normal cell division
MGGGERRPIAAAGPAGGRLRRPVQRGKILAPQCVDQSQNAGADVAYAGMHATLRLIDMPGYGHAAASKEKTASWTRLIGDFLRGRVPLLRVFLLIDGRHGAKPIDIEMLDFLDQSAMSYQIVLTKQDEVKAAERAGRLASTLALVNKRPAAFPEAIFTSSRSGEGVAELRATIARLLAERGTLGDGTP